MYCSLGPWVTIRDKKRDNWGLIKCIYFLTPCHQIFFIFKNSDLTKADWGDLSHFIQLPLEPLKALKDSVLTALRTIFSIISWLLWTGTTFYWKSPKENCCVLWIIQSNGGIISVKCQSVFWHKSRGRQKCQTELTTV